MEAKKVTFGCCVGVPVGLFAAWLFAPMFWWIGIIAGFCAGYICYDLKQIWQKAPIALKIATNTGLNVSEKTLEFFKKPHPFLVFYLICAGLLSLFWGSFLFYSEENFLIALLAMALLNLYGSLIFVVMMLILANIGSIKHRFGENCYWSLDNMSGGLGKTSIEPTYWNIYRLALKGVWIIIYFVCCQMWLLMLKFVWTLIKLIHSHGRILCGMDSAIGVTLTYWLLGTKTKTPTEFILLMVFGGLIGWTIGTIHYKIIKLTKIVPV